MFTWSDSFIMTYQNTCTCIWNQFVLNENMTRPSYKHHWYIDLLKQASLVHWFLNTSIPLDKNIPYIWSSHTKIPFPIFCFHLWCTDFLSTAPLIHRFLLKTSLIQWQNYIQHSWYNGCVQLNIRTIQQAYSSSASKTFA